jgi:potassium channel subfamily K
VMNIVLTCFMVTMDVGNGSKAEYVVYKLKEMGHVEDEHIHDICLQFDQLDCNNTGKITLARLQDGN